MGSNAGYLLKSFLLWEWFSYHCRHVRYTHPDAVLASNVTLLNIDEKFAVFAVVDTESKEDVLKNSSGPFMYINQFNLCSELIRMPLESFLQLSEEVGDPKGKLVILSNTGRCGSTLLTKLFEELPNTVSISEPEVLMAFRHEPTFDDETPQRKIQLLQVSRAYRYNQLHIVPSSLFHKVEKIKEDSLDLIPSPSL